jgi:hypothetical protein
MAAIAIYISKDDLTSAFSIAGFILLMFAAPWFPSFSFNGDTCLNPKPGLSAAELSETLMSSSYD